MRLDKTDITILLDKSSSMLNCVEKTIEAVNAFIVKQREGEGEAVLSLIQFNDSAKVLDVNYIAVPINSVEYLTQSTYRPSGMTKLNDAIGLAITAIGDRLRAISEDQRPGTVMLIIQTDGGENSSKIFNGKQIQDMITHQRNKYSWDIVLVGADIDALQLAQDLAIPTSAALQYGKGFSRQTFEKMSANTNAMRSAKFGGNSNVSYTVQDSDRDEAIGK